VKLSFFLVLFLFQQVAISAPYYRFWRGYKRTHHVKAIEVDGKKTFVDDLDRPMSWTDFEDLVNQWLIPATTSCCAESSLVAYLPVLMAEGKKENQVHDEIALIVYRSEEAYQKTREDKSNLEAQVYGPLHSDVFAIGNTKAEKEEDREATSRSLVPVPFKREIDLTPNEKNFFLAEAAYDVLDKEVNWQAGYTMFRLTHIEVDKESLEPLNRYFREMKASAETIGLEGYTVLVTQRYVIEYMNWSSRKSWSDFLKGAVDQDFKKLISLGMTELSAVSHRQLYDEDPLAYDRLPFNNAANIRFLPGKKPSPRVKHPRLE